nr:hypothetical protein BaRGS_000879 [Batillaria attramentaria]
MVKSLVVVNRKMYRRRRLQPNQALQPLQWCSCQVMGGIMEGLKAGAVINIPALPRSGNYGTCVSAGENKVLQLPENSITLSAFVMPKAEGAKRQNQPPVAIIKPKTTADSTDDDTIKSYHWEEISGPLSDRTIDDDTQMLKLKDMPPGFYVFRTDDKGIASYEWIKKSDSLTADMTGVRTVCLQLNNLEVGDYTFTLKVTDTGGNTATSDVHVYVKPETNRPPEAKTAGQITVTLPVEGIVLDGLNSTDDKGVLSYKWKQTSGPTTLTLTSSDQAVAMATGTIDAGEYQFTLTVTDEEEQTASQKLKVIVKKNENHPPVAQAGGERVVLLPVSMVTLDGSASSDDHGIASYLWERDPHSLAAGEVVNSSDHRAVLQLVNLVAGRYVFTLTITDEQGLSSKDTASLLVKSGDDFKNLLEMVLDTDIHHFAEEDKSPKLSETTVNVQSTEEEMSTGYLRLTFFVRTKDSKTASGVDLVRLLRDKLDSNSILSYRIVSLDTVGKIQNSSVMISESDFSSEEETLFVSSKPSNGHLKPLNGVSRQHFKAKLKT